MATRKRPVRPDTPAAVEVGTLLTTADGKTVIVLSWHEEQYLVSSVEPADTKVNAHVRWVKASDLTATAAGGAA